MRRLSSLFTGLKWSSIENDDETPASIGPETMGKFGKARSNSTSSRGERIMDRGGDRDKEKKRNLRLVKCAAVSIECFFGIGRLGGIVCIILFSSVRNC